MRATWESEVLTEEARDGLEGLEVRLLEERARERRGARAREGAARADVCRAVSDTFGG
ncbi:hypothetical protein GCM10009869_10490 [Amnibacterium kyonggiense]